jgi:hypothetical protein
VGTTSYFNHFSEKNKFKPQALGLFASKLLISASDFSSCIYQNSFYVVPNITTINFIFSKLKIDW